MFLADYANRPDAAASWRFLRARRRLGRARRPDGAHRRHDALPRRPDRAPERPHRDDDPAPPARCRSARARTSAAWRADDLVDVENEDWAAALIELGGGTVGSLEASRVIVGPHVRMRFEVHGTAGALAWELERMNELQRFELAEDGARRGLHDRARRGAAPGLRGLPARRGRADGLRRPARARGGARSSAAMRDGEQRGPGLEEMRATARVLDAIERSAGSGGWEPAR